MKQGIRLLLLAISLNCCLCCCDNDTQEPFIPKPKALLAAASVQVLEFDTSFGVGKPEMMDGKLFYLSSAYKPGGMPGNMDFVIDNRLNGGGVKRIPIGEYTGYMSDMALYNGSTFIIVGHERGTEGTVVYKLDTAKERLKTLVRVKNDIAWWWITVLDSTIILSRPTGGFCMYLYKNDTMVPCLPVPNVYSGSDFWVSCSYKNNLILSSETNVNCKYNAEKNWCVVQSFSICKKRCVWCDTIRLPFTDNIIAQDSILYIFAHSAKRGMSYRCAAETGQMIDSTDITGLEEFKYYRGYFYCRGRGGLRCMDKELRMVWQYNDLHVANYYFLYNNRVFLTDIDGREFWNDTLRTHLVTLFNGKEQGKEENGLSHFAPEYDIPQHRTDAVADTTHEYIMFDRALYYH